MTTEIKKPIKHAQFILGMTASYFADKPEWENSIALYDPELFLSEVLPHLIIRQRAGLEKNKSVRQFLPYLIPSQTDDQGTVRFYPYQRCEGIGEETLMGMVSIGYGGHVDGKDTVFDIDSVINLKSTLLIAAARERFEEVEPQEEMKALWNSLEVKLSGEFIASNDNPTDQVHLACIAKLECPIGMVLTCKEPELKTLPMMTAEELLASDYELESWTRKYLEYALTAPQPSEDEIDAGFGNQIANYDPLADGVPEPVNKSIDESLAVVYSSFIKGETVVKLNDYALLKQYEQENKGMPNHIAVVSTIIEAVDFPELGKEFFHHVKAVVSEYLNTRFAPDEMEEFNKGALSMNADDSEMASSIASLEVLQGLVALNSKIWTESISFDQYTVALGALCGAAEQVAVDDNNQEIMLAVGAVIRAHNQTFDALGDTLTDSKIPVRVALETNPEQYKTYWDNADALIAPIFADMSELAGVLQEIMPDVVKEAAAEFEKNLAAVNAAPVRDNTFTPEDQ